MKPSVLLKVDRIDSNGNIREHLRWDDQRRTLCGLVIYSSQDACGNRTCKSCAQIAKDHSLSSSVRYGGEAVTL